MSHDDRSTTMENSLLGCYWHTDIHRRASYILAEDEQAVGIATYPIHDADGVAGVVDALRTARDQQPLAHRYRIFGTIHLATRIHADLPRPNAYDVREQVNQDARAAHLASDYQRRDLLRRGYGALEDAAHLESVRYHRRQAERLTAAGDQTMASKHLQVAESLAAQLDTSLAQPEHWLEMDAELDQAFALWPPPAAGTTAKATRPDDLIHRA